MQVHVAHNCPNSRLLRNARTTHAFLGSSRQSWLGSSCKTARQAVKASNHQRIFARHKNVRSDSAEDRSQPGGDIKLLSTQSQSRLSTQVHKATSNNISIAAEIKPVAKKLGTLWGLLVMAVAYVHHSTTGWVLPSSIMLAICDSNA